MASTKEKALETLRNLNFNQELEGSLNKQDASENINSAILKKEKAIDLTPPRPSTQADGLAGTIEASQDNFKANLQSKADTSKQREQKAFDQLIQQMLGQEGGIEKTADEFARDGGVNNIQVELDSLDDQLRQEQHSNRRRLESLEKNPQGLFGGGLQAEMSRVNKESIKKQADLSIIQQGVQGRFDSAKTIADRAVQVQLEQQQNLNQALQINYSRFKDLFTKDEQRQFEFNQSDRNRKLDKEEKELQQISDLSIQALMAGASGAVISAIRQSETFDDALKIGGDFLRQKPKASELDELLSISEAKELGVPFGTTKRDLLGQTLGADDVPNERGLFQKEENINLISGLLNNTYLNNAVGSQRLQRLSLTSLVTSGKSDFVASVEQLTSQLSLDALIRAKEDGATFGALSDTEMQILSSSATKIANWKKEEVFGTKTEGYKTTPDKFKAELDKINRFANIDYLIKGGNPENIGLVTTDDGNIWYQNYDGSLTHLTRE